jgi:hypothetical protein
MKNILIYDFLTKLKIVPDVTEIITIKDHRKIYKIITPNKHFRLDINQPLCVNDLQKMAYENGVNVPKIHYYGKVWERNIFKLSDWIDGNLWLDNWDNSKLFELVGEQMGKLNSIKHQCWVLVNSDTNSSGIIYTKDKKAFIVDLNTLQLTLDPDPFIVKTLTKRIKDRSKIDLFLKGYSKIRNCSNIVKLCENINWKWNV